MIPAETIIVYLDCLGEEGNNSLVACYRRSACGPRTRCSVVKGREFARMDPKGEVFLNHLQFTGSPVFLLRFFPPPIGLHFALRDLSPSLLA